MHQHKTYQDRFDELRCCVLVPTFNNEKTLVRVLQEVQEYTGNIIVINDGSSDNTAALLASSFNNIETVSFPVNKGKGNALKAGFKRAQEKGYDYAISMDSDGQHFPDDLHVFLEALEKKKPDDPEILIIGSRKMDHPSVPEKSSVGNRFSSFWFWVETGIQLEDTQCGYRLYPLKVINSLSLYTSRFELEIEVIVKAAWQGVAVKNLPVKVLYDPVERVTHFKPFQDVARITLLNIYFVVAGLCYIFPRNLYRKINRAGKKIVEGNLSEANLPLKKK